MTGSSARRWITRLVGTGVGLLCLVYLLVSFEWPAVLPVLWAAHPLWLLGGGSGSIILYWMLRALRWFILLRRAGVAVNPFDLYMCSAVSLSLAIITPLQSGEVLKVEWLRRYGLRERIPGYSSFALERLADLLVVGVLAAVSIWGGLGPGNQEIVALGGLVLALLSLLGVWAIRTRRISDPARGTLWHLQRYVSDGPTVMLVLLLTFLAWVVVALGWQVCLYSISVALTIQEAIALMSVVTVINILSCVPGAVGVSEVSSAGFLLRQGQSVPLAQAGALALRFYGVLILLLGVGHLLLWNAVRAWRGRAAAEE